MFRLVTFHCFIYTSIFISSLMSNINQISFQFACFPKSVRSRTQKGASYDQLVVYLFAFRYCSMLSGSTLRELMFDVVFKLNVYSCYLYFDPWVKHLAVLYVFFKCLGRLNETWDDYEIEESYMHNYAFFKITIACLWMNITRIFL